MRSRLDNPNALKIEWLLLVIAAYLTSKNRYVSRQEGWNIAKAMGQIKWGLEASDNGECSQLISENLY